MGVLDRLRGSTVATMTETADDYAPVAALEAQVELLQESLADLEHDNRGWLLLDGARAQQDFTRQGLNEIAAAARLNWIANPLIRRAVNVRTYYTWGQGVEIAARDETVNEVVQAFLDDETNQAVLFSHQAREMKDQALQQDGNLFFALFTDPVSGAVQIRSVPFAEVTRVISDPDDAQQRWFYVREWSALTVDPATGSTKHELRKAFYPDVTYRPRVRPSSIGGHEVRWDSPLVHVRTGGLDGMEFGVSDVYAALGWARLYKGFLEDWASLAKALSKFAWKGTTKTGRVGALRRGLEAQPAGSPLRETAAGQAFVADGASDLTPISKTGATLDADSGRPLAMMVGAAMDLPYTILMGDADMGNLATAKTLDRPTELAMTSRREVWSGVLQRLTGYAVDQAVKAPRGPLTGTVTRDAFGRERILLAGDVDRNVDIVWPSILSHDIADLVSAIVEADSTGRIPPETVCRLLLTALGLDDVDDLMAELLDDNGEFIDPGLAAAASAGQQAIDAFRRGEDPAAAALMALAVAPVTTVGFDVGCEACFMSRTFVATGHLELIVRAHHLPVLLATHIRYRGRQQTWECTRPRPLRT